MNAHDESATAYGNDGNSPYHKKQRKVVTAVLLLILLVAIAIAVPLVIHSTKKEADESDKATTSDPSLFDENQKPSTSPSTSPVSIAEAYAKDLKKVLQGTADSSNILASLPGDSPHTKALEWMMTQDFPSLANDYDYDDSDQLLLERFIIAMMYYEMDGSNWLEQLDFVNPNTSVCDWRREDPYWQGIFCGKTDAPGHVTDIILWENNLHNSIPTELGLLSNLWGIHFRDNSLQGPIPSELGRLSRMMTFSLENNSLSSQIPTELGMMTQITLLRMQNNQLTGKLPMELSQLTTISTIEVHGNQLECITKESLCSDSQYPSKCYCAECAPFLGDVSWSQEPYCSDFGQGFTCSTNVNC